MGKIFTNSPANKTRIQEWIGRDDAIVLYPPVDTDFFRPKDLTGKYKNLPDQFFISFSRLTHAK